MTEFRQAIRDDAAANATRYDKFESEARKEQVRLGLLDRSGGKPLAWAIGILFLLFAVVYPFWGAVAGSRWAPFLIPGFIVSFVINVAIVFRLRSPSDRLGEAFRSGCFAGSAVAGIQALPPGFQPLA